jgi:hypothetical protein
MTLKQIAFPLAIILPVLTWGENSRLTAQTPTDANLERYMKPTEIPRFALVIGTEEYSPLARVTNATNDALQFASSLERVGFTNIRVVIDPKDADTIYQYVEEIGKKASVVESQHPVIVVFFFAGHGFQQGAFNYIVPAKARNDNDANIKADSIPLSSIMESLATHKTGLSVFFVDACRTTLSLTTTTGSIANRGFSPMYLKEGTGAILSLASGYGMPARSYAKWDDKNSPFTSGLYRWLPEPISLHEMFDEVRNHVFASTGDQTPFEVIGANASHFYFPMIKDRQEKEKLVWLETLKTRRTDCIRNYQRNYPGSYYLRSAHDWLTDSSVQAIPTGTEPCPRE